ncbi:MAG: hypothetical protein ING19_01505 [Azospirillum sp.]|nr:hypothetical protein [Azospirillum sp.]
MAIGRAEEPNWFSKLFGFHESGYEETRARFVVRDGKLISKANGASFEIGRLETPSLAELRAESFDRRAPNTVRHVVADIRDLHKETANAGALFQVASQVNLLEMLSPEISPEDGVSAYEIDPTQGPACAIAAGAATVYRNYFAPAQGGEGQTRKRQIDVFSDFHAVLMSVCGRSNPVWNVRNGYPLPIEDEFRGSIEILGRLDAERVDALRGALRIGLHWDIEATEAKPRHRVSQAFCAAMPIAYSRLPPAVWAPIGQLVLEAAYEATLLAAAANARRGVSNAVFLTRIGGGAFGNPPDWIDAAIHRALGSVEHAGLDIRIVARR